MPIMQVRSLLAYLWWNVLPSACLTLCTWTPGPHVHSNLSVRGFSVFYRCNYLLLLFNIQDHVEIKCYVLVYVIIGMGSISFFPLLNLKEFIEKNVNVAFLLWGAIEHDGDCILFSTGKWSLAAV